MYCKKCGKQIPDDVDFCPGCGEPQRTSSPTGSGGTVKKNSGSFLTKKNILIALAAVIAIIILVALVSGSNNSPEKCVKNRLNALHGFDVKDVKEEIGEDFVEDFLIDTSSDVDIIGILKRNSKYVDYDIVSCNEDGDHATVDVTLKYKDGTEVFDVFLDELKQNSYDARKLTDDQMIEMLFSAYDKIDMSKADDMEETVTIKVKKEDDKWTVDGSCDGAARTAAIYLFGMTEEKYENGLMDVVARYMYMN